MAIIHVYFNDGARIKKKVWRKFIMAKQVQYEASAAAAVNLLKF